MTPWNLIVVGVDGSDESRKALRWACSEAASHGQEVLAVATWASSPMPVAPPFGYYFWKSSSDMVDHVRRMLGEIVDQIASEFPEVKVRQEVASGNASAKLIQLSAEADLVVVGARGHGGFAGMLIGSVSQHVLAHSRCTVVVVR